MGTSLPILTLDKRSCGECSKCCEGWLEGDIFGRRMYPGVNCFFLEKGERGCTIYESRPLDPCRNYRCAWLDEVDGIPAWLKPNLSDVIITRKLHGGASGIVSYYEVVEAGKKMDVSVLNWLVHWALDKKLNVVYTIDGRSHALGDQDFLDLMKIKSV